MRFLTFISVAVAVTACVACDLAASNGGVTTLEIAKDELPPGQSLTFAVRPLTSLGTKGKTIGTTWRV